MTKIKKEEKLYISEFEISSVEVSNPNDNSDSNLYISYSETDEEVRFHLGDNSNYLFSLDLEGENGIIKLAEDLKEFVNVYKKIKS